MESKQAGKMKKPRPIDETIYISVLNDLKQEVKRIVVEDFILATLSYTFWIMYMYQVGYFFPFVTSPGYTDQPLFGTPVTERAASLVFVSFINFITVTGFIALIGNLKGSCLCLHIWYLSHTAITVFAGGFLMFVVCYYPKAESACYIPFLICPIIYRAGRISHVRCCIVALDYFIMKNEKENEDGRGYFQWSDPIKDPLEESTDSESTPSCYERILCFNGGSSTIDAPTRKNRITKESDSEETFSSPSSYN